MKKRWKIKSKPDKSIVEDLSKSINVSQSVSCILAQRGIDNFELAKDFFRPQLSQLHSPFLMKNMHKAVERINLAIANSESIMIYGDYDVDGTTSVALVYGFLKKYYPNIIHYIPDRYTEGYGISDKGIDVAAEKNIKLIIALDCGIRSVDKVEYAKQKNIDFIICDHHLPAEIVPDAAAVLDAKQKDCNYPYKELSGCGVGFKLLQALCETNSWDIELLLEEIDLLAISIASDIVHVTGENRVLAYFGLKKVNERKRPGINAILDLNKFKKELDITDLVFVIGPRINAAGRIGHATNAVEMLLAETKEEALEKAKEINILNTDRKTIDKSITEEAVSIINGDELLLKRKTTVMYSENWHKGVVGIVASRLIEKFYRPTILLAENNGELTGSARSVDGFDVYQAICECEEFIEKFGGHTQAAGLTIKKENFILFADKFEQVVTNTITEDQLNPSIDIDLEISFDEINQKMLNVINQMSPFGPENMRPVFCTKNVSLKYSPKLLNDSHLKMNLEQKSGSKNFDAIAFNLGHYFQDLLIHENFDICYTIEENEWNGNKTIQLNIKDIKFD
jgi:single-stranded-DNA-specific exonuclease